MYLTQKNHLRGLSKQDYQLLRRLTHLSKNLYNHTLYIVRHYYFANGSFLQYEQAYHSVKFNENYERLPSQVAQKTMKMINRSMCSFFGLLRERQMGHYNRPIRLPSYLPKDGFFVCIFPKDMFKIEGKKIRLSLGRYFAKELGVRYLYFPLPSHVIGKPIKEVRLLPRFHGRYFEIEYVYEVDPERPPLDAACYLSVDLGLDNFATCVSTDGTAFLLEGKGLKSYNRWWNKQKARLQSIYAKQEVKMGSKLACLLWKRKNVVNNYLNQAVNQIIKYCLANTVGNVVIGELKEIKQQINLGKNPNQNFVALPFGLFKQKLKVKCEYYGIAYHEVEERDTSKTCSRCGVLRKANRKYRGLYACHMCGSVRNADVNGAINILKKVVPESLSRGIGNSGRVNRPVRIRLLTIVGQHPSHEAPTDRAGKFTPLISHRS